MSAMTIQSDWVGRVIDGRFSLLQWLGGGTRSGVFLTELPGSQAKKAAIKLTPDDGADADSYVAGWASARPLTHPNLMRLIHAGRCESEGAAVLFAVSEYADEVLSEILPERALTPEEAREMLVPVIDALRYLHEKGRVHGHLKPENVLVVEDRLKISGDRLQMAGETGQSQADQGIYDAPERANGTISPAGDVWSLGVLLVEALTQRPPVWDREAGDVPLVPDSIPLPLAGIARECLRVDPESRCTLANVKTWLTTGQPGVAESDAKTGNRKPGRLALVGAAVVVAAVFAVVALRSKTPEQTVPAQADVQQRADDAAASSAQDQAQGQPAEAGSAGAIKKPSPGVAAGSAPHTSTEQQAPVSEAHVAGSYAMQGSSGDSAVAQKVMPDYLPKALDSIHGKFIVRVRVQVDGAGNVTNAAYESPGPSGYFAKAALDAAKKWKFKPSPSGASSRWILQFLFTHEGPQVTTTADQ